MAELKLNVHKRNVKGSNAVRKMRYEDKIPGIYYIHGEDNIPVYIERTDLQSIWGHESALLNAVFGDGDSKKCIIRDIQYDPVRGTPIHVDLMGIKMDEKITVSVPLNLIGTAEGVKNGGILQQQVREIELECLPGDMPEFIEVDISELEIGDNLTIETIDIKNVDILMEQDTVIATVTVPSLPEEEEEEEELEEELEEGAEPEVIGQKSEQEEEEEEE